MTALVGMLGSAAALWFQRTNFDPLDRIMLPGIAAVWLILWVGLQIQKLQLERAQFIIYCAYALYFLLALNHQFQVFAPHYHTLSQNTYWFAPLYAVAFLFFLPQRALQLSVGLFSLSLLITVMNFLVNPALLKDAPLLAACTQFLLVGAGMTTLQAVMGRCHAVMLATQVAAYQDALTGAANRRAAEEHLLTLDEQQAPFTLALLDMDYFKAINDQYGHGIGDQVLCAVVGEMQRLMPSGTVVSRWGGEEFLLILPALPADEVRRLLQRLRDRLETKSVGPVKGVTASVGVAERHPEETPTSVLARADQALYEAKELGRDRIQFASAPSLPPLPDFSLHR